MECWHKRSAQRLEHAAASPAEWVGVVKRRASRRCLGCRVELTALEVEHGASVGLAFQTLALELCVAADPAATLTQAAHALFVAHPNLRTRFSGALALGYPAWVAGFS